MAQGRRDRSDDLVPGIAREPRYARRNRAGLRQELSNGWIDAVRPSRRPLRGLLKLRKISSCHEGDLLMLRSDAKHCVSKHTGPIGSLPISSSADLPASTSPEPWAGHSCGP